MSVMDKFKIENMTCIITGGAGLLGEKYSEAVIEAGGHPILLDISEIGLQKAVSNLNEKYHADIDFFCCDICNEQELEQIRSYLLQKYGHIDILINNAANNPKVGDNISKYSRFETFAENLWDDDVNVGLKGSFLCTKVFGSVMAAQHHGVILNISSDLGVIGPDQRIYRKAGVDEEKQNTKPVTYSVVKHGLIGLTKYTATYWAESGIRANAICPGGVYTGQDDAFLKKLTNLIPMGRMADEHEYKAAILFLISDASSYMTGSVITIDGGRTCW